MAHGLRHALCAPAWARFDIVGQQAEHALGAEAAGKGPDRIGVGVGFRRALGRRTLGQQHERTNQFIAPLHLIDKMEFQLGKVQHRCHGVSPSPCSPGVPGGAR